jgi:xanthine dehydrogenase accessory factor
MTAAEAMQRLQRADEGGEVVVEVVVVGAEGVSVRPGARLLVGEQRVDGSLGDAGLDAAVHGRAVELLTGEGSRRERLEWGGGALELYLAVHRPPDDLLILGAGHIARPLCATAALLGYRVTVLDDRPDFATFDRFPEAAAVLRVSEADPFAGITLSRRSRIVLATRGHRFDFEALRRILGVEDPPGYIGMVGSRRRVRATLEQLVREGVPVERLEAIHAPVGLDIGAETPEEIAVAIAAELVCLRRGGAGGTLRERDAVVRRWIATAE